MTQQTTIELFKEDMKFSAGHFTILSPTRRERLHGHNFRTYAAITSMIPDDGIVFDYGIYKKKLQSLCTEWNEIFLIPAKSPYVRIETEGEHLYVHFAEDRIPFLRKDVLLLPIANITVEELAQLMLTRLTEAIRPEDRAVITRVEVKIFSGPGQSASARWSADA
ncbi:MAG: 6-carboxytetrahydropterin synthase [Myxococcota bacterium]